jgi:hypothetical protein
VAASAKNFSIDGPHRPDGIYVIRFRNVDKASRQSSFLRGYGLQGGTGIGFTASAPGFGEALTIMALAVRSCDHLKETMRQNEI